MGKDDTPRLVLVNKYPPQRSGGIESALNLQCSLVNSQCIIVSLEDDDRFQFSISKWQFSLESFLRLFRALKKTDITGVLINHPSPFLAELALLIGRVKGKKIAVYYHCAVLDKGVIGYLYNFFWDRLLGLSDIICISSDRMENAIPPYCKKKIKVVPFACSPDFELLRKGVRRKKVILYFGRLSKYKNIDRFMEIATCFPEEQFVVAGKSDSSFISCSVPSNVTVFDRYFSESEKCRVLESASVLVLPSVSKAETFGIVQLEALACGCKLLRFDNGLGVATVAEGEAFVATVRSDTLDSWCLGLERLNTLEVSPMEVRQYYEKNLSVAIVKGKYDELESLFETKDRTHSF